LLRKPLLKKLQQKHLPLRKQPKRLLQLKKLLPTTPRQSRLSSNA
jgi:hypothetical protein